MCLRGHSASVTGGECPKELLQSHCSVELLAYDIVARADFMTSSNIDSKASINMLSLAQSGLLRAFAKCAGKL